MAAAALLPARPQRHEGRTCFHTAPGVKLGDVFTQGEGTLIEHAGDLLLRAAGQKFLQNALFQWAEEFGCPQHAMAQERAAVKLPPTVQEMGRKRGITGREALARALPRAPAVAVDEENGLSACTDRSADSDAVGYTRLVQ